MLPAWERHPGVGYTKEIESGPTIVASAQPKFPERVTELERRLKGRMRQLEGVERENAIAGREMEKLHSAVTLLRQQNEILEKSRAALVLAVGNDERELAETLHEQRQKAKHAEEKVVKLKKEVGEAAVREELLLEEMADLQRKVKGLEERALRAEGKGA